MNRFGALTGRPGVLLELFDRFFVVSALKLILMKSGVSQHRLVVEFAKFSETVTGLELLGGGHSQRLIRTGSFGANIEFLDFASSGAPGLLVDLGLLTALFFFAFLL